MTQIGQTEPIVTMFFSMMPQIAMYDVAMMAVENDVAFEDARR